MRYSLSVFSLILLNTYVVTNDFSYSSSAFNIMLLNNGISLRKSDGKIEIPNHIKHIKLDIGLSYSAPMSQYWLSHEKDLLVFGFEPNPACVESIFKGATKWHPSHGDPLEPRFVNKNFF